MICLSEEWISHLRVHSLNQIKIKKTEESLKISCSEGVKSLKSLCLDHPLFLQYSPLPDWIYHTKYD